ncbi:PREDICTED: tubulin-specific chaperone A-like [Amphimedon queenslandica]|uniref:Tubulin-specific chaperone A n=1 Tax=Amphimedon queenslandica TaxID=400682 RepID=A0A1X7U1J5_AMPQE|nr:PREDICTED: tubulin-specific chaperone A-like [Amphimedon queenslandica]|eukprot:XP_003389273.1 PREDICTED: tubulin-specific chaperone A-like [Amphimedon queenslandica]
MADVKRVRTIKIKTGVVKRLSKEKNMYIKEAEKQEEKIQKMTEEGRDEYDIRKQKEVLAESHSMIPDIERQLEMAHNELSKLLETETDLADTEEYKVATELLKTIAV